MPGKEQFAEEATLDFSMHIALVVPGGVPVKQDGDEGELPPQTGRITVNCSSTNGHEQGNGKGKGLSFNRRFQQLIRFLFDRKGNRISSN